MKRFMLAVLLFLPASVRADVPQEINYSGRLQQSDGSPYTNQIDVTVEIYDAQSGGNALYAEDIGTIPVQNGVYSFNFGASGTSVVTVTEQVGITDGSNTVFGYTTAHKPILSPSVTITDGVYTWNDLTGSSSSANFLGSVSSYSNGTVSAIYLSGAPTAGRTISISYSYNDAGVARTLLGASTAWPQVTVNGETLTPRSQLVAVPYAKVAERVAGSDLVTDPETGITKSVRGGFEFPDGSVQDSAAGNAVVRTRYVNPFIGSGGNALRGSFYFLPVSISDGSTVEGFSYTAVLNLPENAEILGISGVLNDTQNYTSNTTWGRVSLRLNKRDTTGSITTLATASTTSSFSGGDYPFDIPLSVPYATHDASFDFSLALYGGAMGSVGLKSVFITYRTRE